MHGPFLLLDSLKFRAKKKGPLFRVGRGKLGTSVFFTNFPKLVVYIKLQRLITITIHRHLNS